MNPQETLDALRPWTIGRISTPPKPASLNRRSFFKISATATGGLLIGLNLAGMAAPMAEAAPAPAPAAGPFEPNVFLRLDADDAVTVTATRSDMGQGIRTTLAMILADELDADWSKVRVEQASYGEQYGNQGTGGSGSTRTLFMPLREAGATARAMLVRAAAETWGVTPAECRTENGVVHGPDGNTLSYGALAEKAAALPVPETPALKDPSEFHIIGTRQHGVDVPDLVAGKARFGSDVQVPEMRYAAVARPPMYGGTVASFDASAAEAVPGVEAVVEIPPVPGGIRVHGGVAVIANTTWAALKGRDALEIEWNEGPHAAEGSEAYEAEMQALVRQPGTEVHAHGDAGAVLDSAEDKIVAEFALPFLAHATMEPMNCTAVVTEDSCEVWGPIQTPEWAATALASTLERPIENVQVHVTLLGGGFGRRINPDVPVEAALVARAAGVPVKVQWTREDDMQHDFYRPTSYHRLEAVLDEDGLPEAMRHRMSSTSIQASLGGPEAPNQHRSEVEGAVELPYAMPNRRLEYTPLQSGIARGWWRSVAHSHNGFVIESFIDELAAAAGRDPYEYRLALLDESITPPPDDPFAYDPARMKGVLERVAEQSGWGDSLPAGHAVGMASQYSFRTYAAEVVEISQADDGAIKVHRVVAAIDCGTVINPDGAEAQVMGAIIDGISTAFNGEITVENGRVQQSNFHDYPLLKMSEHPDRIEVYFVDSGKPPSGLGEPGMPPVAPAIANAYFRLTGKRLRRLPFRTEELRLS